MIRLYTDLKSMILFFLGSAFFLTSCMKEESILPDEGENYAVNFAFPGFSSVSKPLASDRLSALKILDKRAAVGNMHSYGEEEYLYFWSFNQESLIPDIRINKETKITYNGGNEPTQFGAGFTHADFPAGRALSFNGVEDIEFALPLTNITHLSEVGFDISSSNTGPKAFHLLYSNDGGETYKMLSEDNQFMNLKNQTRNTFSFSLDTIEWDYANDLLIKLLALSGERDTLPDMKSTGATRIDNFYLSGQGEFPPSAATAGLYYWIFDYVTKQLVQSDHLPYETDIPNITLSLPKGRYITHFVSHVAEQELITPKDMQSMEQHYISSYFADHLAEVNGSIDTINIDQNQSVDITLGRYHSAIKFELTDDQSLEDVSLVRVNRVKDPYFYAPFNLSMSNPIMDQSDIELEVDFTTDSKVLYFHQFVGNSNDEQELDYEVEVFAGASLLRSFRVSASAKNNTQLIFRGKLLEDPTGTFTFSFNEEWDGEKEVEF